MDGAVIFEKIIKDCGGFNYNFLEEDRSFRLFLEKAALKKFRYKSWKNHFMFLVMLNSKGYIKRDFGNTESLAKKLAGNSEYAKQTMALPENIASFYFDNSIKTVEKYHPYRKNISELYDVFIKEFISNKKNNGVNYIECRKKALKKAHYYSSYDIKLDMTSSWLSWLRGACYIVIAGFTGCRDGEIKSFNLDSYVEKKYGDVIIPLLNGIDTKPNIGGAKRSVSWVTIPTASKAIELLWDAYEFARIMWREEYVEKIHHVDEKNRFLDGINSLFIAIPFAKATQPKVGRQAISDSIKNFVKSLNYKANINDVKEFNLLNPTRVNELKVGDILIPHPHAFRRTFAVFFVRNKLGSLIDLKYQFKHMNIIMTSWYSNQAHLASFFDMMIDEDLISEIADENYAYITDTLYYIYNDAETLAGPEGKRILNLRSESSTTIYLSREEIAAQVSEGRMSIIEHPTGHCTNPRCDRVCDMTICQYKIVTKEKAVSLIEVRERLINKFNALVDAKVNQPNILSKLYYEVRSIEKVFDEHQMSYIKFSGEISVSLL
ncbi:hypothetical protein QC823_07530 [Halomonas vilamensis]|uniref:Site-specific integrase n=1 Tax=Vreelandella vilamensis TaxID=531309 RepID=A0ABU1H3F4_9GAMM|nr:hypothetical protein [Halomonas vilamensis]MDR5898837.1 hypothetical protein [Halomonas vilamensis]